MTSEIDSAKDVFPVPGVPVIKIFGRFDIFSPPPLSLSVEIKKCPPDICGESCVSTFPTNKFPPEMSTRKRDKIGSRIPQSLYSFPHLHLSPISYRLYPQILMLMNK
jgi:hypothetical protein